MAIDRSHPLVSNLARKDGLELGSADAGESLPLPGGVGRTTAPTLNRSRALSKTASGCSKVTGAF
jgi:hypothetical protein